MLNKDLNEVHNNKEIDSQIELIKYSKQPIKTILKIIKKHGSEHVIVMLNHSVLTGNINVANLLYKGILLDRLHKINIYMGKVEEGNNIEYLEKLPLSEKVDLANGIFTKLTLSELEPKYLEHFMIIDEMIKNERKAASMTLKIN